MGVSLLNEVMAKESEFLDAAKNGKDKLVTDLLGLYPYLVNVKGKGPHGTTAVELAAEQDVRGSHLDVVDVLIKAGADFTLLADREVSRGVADKLDAKMGLKETELRQAARQGFVKKVRCLLQSYSRLKPDVTDTHGNAPLHLASRNGHIETARYLVDAKAHPWLKNGDGKTPLDLAQSGKTPAHKEIEKILLA